MSEYQALYRAWRPDCFKDIYGQEPITRTLRNQIISGRIAHAYLFCGSRGTGKTTTAKVFSRAINCLTPVDGEPCGECSVCQSFKNEATLDLVEIDAASHTTVDGVRDLIDHIAYPPTVGKYKVYIIDEVHMLSNSAFNALLKTLEEPPAHAVFVLATTEPQKLPATVLSRCQRFDFKRISVKDISARLKEVLSGIGRECTEDAIDEIAVSADGGMRDALSLMDMCLGSTDGVVDAELVRQVLGTNGRKFMFEFTDALCDCDPARALQMIADAMLDGRDPVMFTREVASHMRTILLAQMTGEKVAELAELTREDAQRFISQGERYDTTRLMRSMDLFIRAEGEMRYAAMPRSIIEMDAVRCARISNEKTEAGLNERLERLEKQISQGSFIPQSEVPVKPVEYNAPPSEYNREPAPVAVAVNDDGMMEIFNKAKKVIEEREKQLTLTFRNDIKYLKTSDDVIYTVLPSDKEIFTTIINNKKDNIEHILNEVYGRKMKLNVTIEGSAPQPGHAMKSNEISEVREIMGDNLEVVE